MELQFSITILLRVFTAGWYAVTKGNILSAVFCFCGLRAAFLESKITSDKDLSIYFFGYPRASRRCLNFVRHSSNVVFEEFVLSSRIASPLIKPLFYPWRVARSEMGILKGFGRLVVSFDIQDGFCYESFSFEHNCVKESYFVL